MPSESADESGDRGTLSMRAHTIAILAVAATFLLLVLGGAVHGTGSSLACPDWPTCYGEWMPRMRGGILYEHSHRVAGAAVGVLTIVLAVVLRRTPLSVAGALGVVLVVVQGLLGGVTVLLRLPTAVSTAHLGIAMLFFCLLVWVAWRTRPGTGGGGEGAVRWRPVATWTLGLLYAQILLGALVRHTGAGLACPDVPFCYGRIWPPAEMPLGAAHLHMLHRLVGAGIAVLVIALSVGVLRSRPGSIPHRLAVVSITLVVVQVAFGLLSVTSVLGAVEVTVHTGVAALLLACVLLLRLALAPPTRPVVVSASRPGETPS